MAEKILTGKVIWFDIRKGLGFIGRDDGEKDEFVHFSNIEMEGFKTLHKGDVVSFELGANHKGSQAVKVKVLKFAPKEEAKTETTDEE